jgi:hypothetical protein
VYSTLDSCSGKARRIENYRQLLRLKVPKREIFDRSDFPDFYTMKSLRVGDFGVKIKQIFKNI